MIVIGHRGARGLAPENTIAGLRKALEHKVDMVEVDLRVTSDGIVVLSHNPTITDASGSKLLLIEHKFEELQVHKPDLTILDDAFVAVQGKVRLFLEVKPGEQVEPIISIIRAQLAGGYDPTKLLIGSKSQKTLIALHQALPELETIVIEPWSGVRATWRARHLQTKLIAMRSWWLWPGFISAVHNSGYQLVAYTMNNPAKVKRWEKYKLYGVVTDFPDRFETKSD